MKFYNREKEIERLLEIQKKSQITAQMTVVTGRRRIGKTQLLLRATEGQPTLYFFVARKAEALLCQDFSKEIELKLGTPIIGRIEHFGELFNFLMKLSQKQSFNLIIDEFQEFYSVAPSAYSDMQHHWDINKENSKINLLLSGSVYSLMHKIFQGTKEPLFGRATNKITVKPFNTNTLKEILKDHNNNYSSDDLIALYAFTGGVAKYVQLLMDAGAFTQQEMLSYIIKEDSLFISEGKNMLIDEFGKEYTNYFSILSSIARGENTRAKIEAIVGKEIGGYLTKLEQDYSLIVKSQPVFSKNTTKNVRYILRDNFLTFWFRFIFKYSHIIEIEAFDKLREIINRDYPTYSGIILEKFFADKLKETGNYTIIGRYWDRKGENEIDIIAINEIDKSAEIIEVKRQHSAYNENLLHKKYAHLLTIAPEIKNYNTKIKGLSLDDI